MDTTSASPTALQHKLSTYVDRKTSMTTTSSAALFTSAKGFGPFYAPGWRLGTVAELAEGGTNGPFWVIREPESSAPLYLPLVELDVERMVSSIALLLAGTTQDLNLEGLLIDTHNLNIANGTKSFAPFWDLSEQDVDRIFRTLSQRVRLGFTILEEHSLLTDPVIDTLNSKGMEVELFRHLTYQDDSSPRFSS